MKYRIPKKMTGINTKRGNSAICFVRKYTSVLYMPLKCSLRKIGTSIVMTLMIANILDIVIRGGDTSMAGMTIAIPGVLNISESGATMGKIR